MKILAFPKGIENPYQELLYTQMRAQGDIVDYFPRLSSSATLDLALFLPRLIVWRLRGYRVFHMHWASFFSLRATVWRIKPMSTLVYWYYLLCIRSIKLFGYTLVWTAHNVLPHEPSFLDDVAARRHLLNLTDLVIAHSSTTLAELEKVIGVKPKKSVVIPHGSYVGIYPSTMTREKARQELGLEPDTFVYMYLGLIREYKGVDVLLDTFQRISCPDSALVVAGACFESKLRDSLQKKAVACGAIWHNARIPDKDLQVYFNAADVVVLPFKAVTTSGSALLALSFGKAVIVPSIGDLVYLPDSVCYKYVPTESHGLETKMLEAREDSMLLKQKSADAYAYAQKLSWPNIARQTRVAIQELFK